ncbi:MAG: hypothetical protein A3I05_05295 [Deltaproteobacteria bacterium RIFCSPLOWO2_02_FULL_44_10]|nr:MAG: hypothetical protein A3I05_05295 [Deltaproteobacteria bacterium RIFCSPLOWO2_02_FULL_44_10]
MSSKRKMPSPREELLKLHQRLYRRNRDVIESSVLVEEPGFDQYERSYSQYVRDYRTLSSHEQMVKALLRADIIYVGDYHTLNQSQRSFLRILKTTVVEDPHFIVGLELFHERYQPFIDRYLAGKITEKTFLQRVKLKEHWVFDLWENFKPIFDFCRYHHIPIQAIDAAPYGSTVRERDRATAKLIARLQQEHPQKKFFVFIGDLHIAPPHLPRDVKREMKKAHLSYRDIILYQNSVPIYWKLAKEELQDRVEVVYVDDRSYCRMHTPPIIAQQSYLNWLDHEEGEIDYGNVRQSFLELVEQISTFLGMRIKQKDLESVEVFTAGDLSFLKRLREAKVFSKEEIETIKHQILSSESYFIAKTRFVYLATLSLNHAAEEASHFMKHVCSGSESPRELIDAFYANILHEALGFWGSKIINHKRKCPHEQDFRELVAYFESIHVPVDRRLEQESAHLILEYLRHEQKGKPLEYADIFATRMDLFISVTHALGYMLGEKLYYGLMDNVISKKEIRQLFCRAWRQKGEPLTVYWKIKKKLQTVRLPKRI